MNTLLDPATLFISEEDWNNESQRDVFLKYLLDNFSTIDKYKITQILWTGEFDELLWCQPNIPPWRSDKDFKNAMVPIIFKFLQKNKAEMDVLQDECSVRPNFQCECYKKDASRHFLKIAHEVLARREDVFFCISPENRRGDAIYTFFCECHETQLVPTIISAYKQWLKYVDLARDFWPANDTEKEKRCFREALTICAETLSLERKNFLYEFDFSKLFMEDLVGTSTYREQVIEAITTRLLLQQNEASRYTGLNDEPVSGRCCKYGGKKIDVRRFRVSEGNRIHYCYIGSNKILFLRYYKEGHHDDGL